VDRFVDRLDSVAVKDPLPEELTLTELILCIKDIQSLQPSSTPLIHRYVRPMDGRDTSTSRQNRPPPSSDSRSSHPPQPDSRPSLFGIFVLALIHSVFVHDGAILLRIASSWPCIFFSQSI
jgi:hypothetical protein